MPLPISRSELLDRELSWLAFNERVLHEALDERTPLLERLKFLGIVSANLDEFFMVRVAGLRRQLVASASQLPEEGAAIDGRLDAIDTRARALVARQYACLDELLDALARRGVHVLAASDLTPADWAYVDQVFESRLYPVLTPLALDSGHPFPYISNLSLSLAVLLRDPSTGVEHFARVKVPKTLVRWVPVGRPNCFVPVEQVIGANLEVLFPGMGILGWYAFRITRYSDLDLTGVEEQEDMMQMVEERVYQRRFSEVVRLEVQADMPVSLQRRLADEFRRELDEPMLPRLSERDVHHIPGLVDLSDLVSLATIDLPELRDPPFVPVTGPDLRESRSIFEIVSEADVLVHHPYESFATSVERFFQEAAQDDEVLAIKSTLYRTSGDTTIVRALTDAAHRGKEVAVVVELKARFDETNNIGWARTLERSGIHVSYGLPGLKTHAKLALVVRREGQGIRRYVHIGTGNYNSKTALLYSDLGLFTADPAIGADVHDLLNGLTGVARAQRFRKLLVAPQEMRTRVLTLIERETERARAGERGRIIAKMNALVDAEVIHALYGASRAGVEIDLIVRGTCCLRPRLAGVSDRIRVRSIIGRFLEHSRIYAFGSGDRAQYYIGSADWMPRNFDRRVEVVVPVEGQHLRERLRAVLAVCLADNRQAWELGPDGDWLQRAPGDDTPHGTQTELLRSPWIAGDVASPSPAAAGSLERAGIPSTNAPRQPR